MLMIPIQSPNHTDDAVILVLDDSNIERMKQADPAQVELRRPGMLHLVNPTLFICYEKDLTSLNKFVQNKNLDGLRKHLSRGFKYKPEQGDHDRGPESLSQSN